MKKLNSIESNENFNKMEETSFYITNQLEALTEELFQELQGLEEDGFYCPLTEEVFRTIPMEERYYQKYYPTYSMSVLLLKYYLSGHKEVYDQMMSTFKASLYMKYSGHGYDSNTIRLQYLTSLYEVGLKEVLISEDNLAREFGLLVHMYREMLHDGKVYDGWGSIEQAIIDLLSVVDKDVLFVYGTLMECNVNAHYLDECPIYGEAIIEGYTLLQLNGYPGMIKMDGGVVAGELYTITPEVKQQLDILEGSQYKYNSGIVSLCGSSFYAHFYEFIPQTNKRYAPAYTVNDKWVDISDYVWYASYGSNLLEERFNIYINRTTSKQKPIASKPIILPYKLYFAKRSSRWNDAGVAFLDVNTHSTTYGWMHLITKEQFKEIKKQEGPTWYGNELLITTDELGIDVYTLTSPYKYDDVKSSKEYLEVVGAGIKQKYNLPDIIIDNYLGVKGYDYSLEHVHHILINK